MAFFHECLFKVHKEGRKALEVTPKLTPLFHYGALAPGFCFEYFTLFIKNKKRNGVEANVHHNIEDWYKWNCRQHHFYSRSAAKMHWFSVSLQSIISTDQNYSSLPAIKIVVHQIVTFIVSVECCWHLNLQISIFFFYQLGHTQPRETSDCSLPHSFINTDNYYPNEEWWIVLEGQAQSLASLGTRLASTALSIRQSRAAVRHRH